MNSMLMSMGMIMMLAMSMTTLMSFLSKKTIIDNEKSTPFECGFNPMSYTRVPFSIHFFMIAIIFLIFDIEIIMIMPMILTMKLTNIKYWIMTSTLFVLILIIGLFHEWKNGMISWTC